MKALQGSARIQCMIIIITTMAVDSTMIVPHAFHPMYPAGIIISHVHERNLTLWSHPNETFFSPTINSLDQADLQFIVYPLTHSSIQRQAT